MTKQEQTDYDKALKNAHLFMDKENNTQMMSKGEVFDYAFRKGYEYGKKQSTADHKRNLIAHGDEYMTASVEAQEKGFKDWENNPYKRDTKAEAYKQGWADADTFDSAWLDSYPEDAFQRILDNHPEIIEDEVKARLRDLENENREKSQNVAGCYKCSDNSLMRYEIAMMAVPALIQKLAWGKDYRRVSQIAVNFADALIKELKKEEE